MGSQVVWERLQTKYEGRTTDLKKREFDLRSKIEAMESLLNGGKSSNPCPPCAPCQPPQSSMPNPALQPNRNLSQGMFNPQSQILTGTAPMDFFSNQPPANYPISHMNFFPQPSEMYHLGDPGLNEINGRCKCPSNLPQNPEEPSEPSGGFLSCIKSMLGRSKQSQILNKEQMAEEPVENMMLIVEESSISSKRNSKDLAGFQCKCEHCEFLSNGRKSTESSPRRSLEATEGCVCKNSAVVTNGNRSSKSFNPQCTCQPCEFTANQEDNPPSNENNSPRRSFKEELEQCVCGDRAGNNNERRNSKEPSPIPTGPVECYCDSCPIMPKSKESTPRRESVKQCSCAEGSEIVTNGRKKSRNSSSPRDTNGIQDIRCGCNGSLHENFEDYPPCSCDDSESVSKDSTEECACSQKSQQQSLEEECNCLNEKSLVSLTSADMFYLQNLQNLATQQKALTNQIKDLEAKEKIYQQVLQDYKGLELKSEADCKCNQATQSSDSNRQIAELKLENLLLRNELKEMRSEVRQYLEKMEGPMQFKIESEKYKCLKLEEQLDQLSNKLGETHEYYQKQIGDLKMELMTATANNFSVNQKNEQMKKAMDDCMIRCNALEDDLLRQKLSDGNTIRRLNDLLEQSQKLATNQKESCNLYDIARDLSQTIKESAPCKDCSRLPSDLTATVQCVKELADIVHTKLPPKKTAASEAADNQLSTESSELVIQEKIEIQTVPTGKISSEVLVKIRDNSSGKSSKAGSEKDIPEAGSRRNSKVVEPESRRASKTPEVESSRRSSKVPEIEETNRKFSTDDAPKEKKLSKTEELDSSRRFSKTAENSRKSSKNAELYSGKSEVNVKSCKGNKSETPKRSIVKSPSKPPCVCSTSKQKELVTKNNEVNQIWPTASERLKVCHQVTASQDLLKSQTSIKCMNVPENFPFDVDTKVDVLEKIPDGVHVTTTITKSGMLEVITEGPEGVIETTLVYTESGNVEVITEILEYSKTGPTSNLGHMKALPPAKSCELPTKSCGQPKSVAPQPSKCIESALKRKARIAEGPPKELSTTSGSNTKFVENETMKLCQCQECPGGSSRNDIESTKSIGECGSKSQHSSAAASRKSSHSDKSFGKEENEEIVDRQSSKSSSKKAEDTVEKSVSMSAHVGSTDGNVTMAVSSVMSGSSSEKKLDVDPIGSSPTIKGSEHSN